MHEQSLLPGTLERDGFLIQHFEVIDAVQVKAGILENRCLAIFIAATVNHAVVP
jgi:hypothetical protein